MAETRIREALELLDGGRRWFKGSLNVTGVSAQRGAGLCALTAARAVNCGNDDQKALNDVALAQYPERVLGECKLRAEIVRFNNHPDTTFADVELVMEKAAVMREEAVE